MENQIQYYNNFGKKFKKEILSSEDPSVWTTDIKNNGPISQEMRARVAEQKRLISVTFGKDDKILDLGCGFGRQAYMLAQDGYQVIGVDSSDVFIEIAETLFEKSGLKGRFFCQSIFNFSFEDSKVHQVLLLDVFEHIEPSMREPLMDHLVKNICDDKAKIIITFPAKETFPFKVKVLNLWKRIKSSKGRQEHPFTLPSREEFESIIRNHFSIMRFNIHNGTNYWVLEKT